MCAVPPHNSISIHRGTLFPALHFPILRHSLRILLMSVQHRPTTVRTRQPLRLEPIKLLAQPAYLALQLITSPSEVGVPAFDGDDHHLARAVAHEEDRADEDEEGRREAPPDGGRDRALGDAVVVVGGVVAHRPSGCRRRDAGGIGCG